MILCLRCCCITPIHTIWTQTHKHVHTNTFTHTDFLFVCTCCVYVCVWYRLQGIGGREAPMKATKPWNNQRFIGMFDVVNTTKQDSGRYRCIVHSTRGVGVSNYGELTIKRESTSYTSLFDFLPHAPELKCLKKFCETLKEHTCYSESNISVSNFLQGVRLWYAVSADAAVRKIDAYFMLTACTLFVLMCASLQALSLTESVSSLEGHKGCVLMYSSLSSSGFRQSVDMNL